MKKIIVALAAFLSLGVTPTPVMKPLMWETKNPKRVKWSEYTFQQIYQNFDAFDSVMDMDFFCPNYNNLNRHQKVNVWGQLISAMSWYESGHNPRASVAEPRLGIDPVTTETIRAEGLLQLGYIDTMWYSYCDFDWVQDRQFEDNDPRKTTFDPYINLKCGIGILANQIEKHGRIVIKRGAYWAVIKDGHKNSRIYGIQRIVSQYDMCKIDE